jgi:hypothetical protein
MFPDECRKMNAPPDLRSRLVVDPRNIPARLDELRTLKDGWLDGGGLAPSAKGLDWLATALDEHFPDNLPLPYVYPVAEGGVQLEWPLKPQEVSLEIDFGQKSGEWHVLNIDTNAEELKSLNLAEEAAWSWVIKRLTELVGATQLD